MDTPIIIRDQRGGQRYFIDNHFLRGGYGRVLGPYGIAVYNVLCLHADGKSQQAFPSYQTIADLSGMSRRQVIRTIKKLEALNLIHVERSNGEAPNRITLLAISAWKRLDPVNRKADQVPQSQPHGEADRPVTLSHPPGDSESPVTLSHPPGDSESPPPVTLSHPNKTHINKTQITNIKGGKGLAVMSSPASGKAARPSGPEGDLDPWLAHLVGLIQDAVGVVSPLQYQDMAETIDELRAVGGSRAWLDQAVKVAVDRNKRSWAYIRAVLANAIKARVPPDEYGRRLASGRGQPSAAAGRIDYAEILSRRPNQDDLLREIEEEEKRLNERS